VPFQLGINVGALAIWAVFMFFVAFFTVPKPKPADQSSSDASAASS